MEVEAKAILAKAEAEAKAILTKAEAEAKTAMKVEAKAKSKE